MSTKTNFKRIALVAVAALGLGVLSSVPAQAAITGLTVTVADGTSSLTKSDSTTAATVSIAGVFGQNDSVTATLTRVAVPTGTVPKTFWHFIDSSTPTGSNAFVETRAAATGSPAALADSINRLNPLDTSMALAANGDAGNMITILKTSAAGYVKMNLGVQLDTTSARVAGTYTYALTVRSYDVNSLSLGTGGLATNQQPNQTINATINIVVAAAANLSTTATATYGFAFLSATTTTEGNGVSTTGDEVISALATTGTTRAFFYVGVRNAANGATTARESLTATVTGAGLVCLNDGSACGKSLGPISATTGDYEFELRGDGSGGLSTVKVTGSVTGASYTKSLNYYAAAAKTLTASVLTPVLAVSTNDSAVAVTAVDAAGANWGGTAYIYASAAADATAVGGSATTPVACVFRSANNTHYCPITATTAGTGKFKVIDASTIATATATSNEVTVTSKVATAASVKISFNKANYIPGEIGLILITPLDAAGNALPASTISNALASGGISSDVNLLYNGAAVTGLDDTTATVSATSGATSVAGSEALVFTAPSGGKITLTAKGGTGLPLAGQVAITASATITDNGAAALAAVNALATTVASLRTLITTLTNLVLKIQKKVKA